MGETHKKFNLRVAEDDKTVLLDCDVSTDELDELVAVIGKELEALDIKDPTTGKIDYREKGAHDSVVKDTLRGRQIPAVEGKNGKNVFGDTLLATKPAAKFPVAGENVHLDTSKNAYYA